jgi:hypothetical protein
MRISTSKPFPGATLLLACLVATAVIAVGCSTAPGAHATGGAQGTRGAGAGSTASSGATGGAGGATVGSSSSGSTGGGSTASASSSGAGGGPVETGGDPCAIEGDAGSAPSSTFFVAPGGSGGDGKTWGSAWKDVAGIDWSVIKPGSTVCIAKGTYGKLSIQASGTASARICIKRAIANDAQCGMSTPGWNAANDGQVVVSHIACNTPGDGDYVTVDGRVAFQGIKVDDKTTDETYSVDLNGSGASYMRLYNLDVAGVSTLQTSFTGEGRSLSANFSGTAHGLEIAYSQFHGKPTLVLTGGQHDMIFENNKLFDNVVENTMAWHPNVWVSISNDVNVVWRYNEIWNWMVEGIMMCPAGPGCTPDSSWYVYGNVWHDATPGGASRVLEAQYVTAGAVYLYDNTFAALGFVMGSHANGGGISGGVATNNLMWQTTADFQGWSFMASHNMTVTVDPFVDSAKANYHLAAGSAPIDAGVPIAPAAGLTFDKDMDGDTRGADGAWDVGAYERP